MQTSKKDFSGIHQSPQQCLQKNYKLMMSMEQIRSLWKCSLISVIKVTALSFLLWKQKTVKQCTFSHHSIGRELKYGKCIMLYTYFGFTFASDNIVHCSEHDKYIGVDGNGFYWYGDRNFNNFCCCVFSCQIGLVYDEANLKTGRLMSNKTDFAFCTLIKIW